MSHSAKKKQPKGGGAGGCFLGCFGSPLKDYYDYVDNKEHSKTYSDGVVMSQKVPKRRSWFFWARKKRSDSKTVPLEYVPEKKKSSKDVNNMVKINKKVKNLSQPLVNHVPLPLPESTSVTRKTNRTRSNSDKPNTRGNKKSSSKTTLDSIEEAICSEENNLPSPTGNVTTNSTAINGQGFGHSVSLPSIYKGKKLVTNINSGVSTLTTVALKSKDTVADTKVDSVIGMSTILVMLLIMLLWGKVCAILCTSAWFYLLPRFRIKNGTSLEANKNSSSVGDQIDINSQEHKKKVELEGFLKRNNNRNNVVSSSK